MSSVIKRGYGTPFVVVYNSEKKALAANESTAKAFITNFLYKYKEDDDDECTISIFLRNHQEIDRMKIKHRTKLFLRWGWLKVADSGILPVTVKSFKRRYSVGGVFYIITCSDLVSQLKYTKDNNTKKTTLLEYLEEITSGRYNLRIENQGKLIYNRPIKVHELKPTEIPHADAGNVEADEDYAQRFRSIYADTTQDWDKLSDLEKARANKKEIVNQLGIETKKVKKLTEDIPYEERDVLGIADARYKILQLKYQESQVDKEIEDLTALSEKRELNSIFGRFISAKPLEMVPFSSSPYQMIESHLKSAPDGPWYIDGTGDTLLIHNRHLERDPRYSYGYREEPGDLLEFTPDMKFKPNRINNYLRTTALDETKGFTTMYHYLHALKNLRPLPEILADPDIGDYMKADEVRTWYMAYLAHDKYGIFQRVESIKEYPDGKRPEEKPEDWEGLDNTILGKLDLHRVYVRREEDADAERDSISNKQREVDMEKSKATLKIIGNPILKNKDTLYIHNVSSEDLGNYYIKEIEHHISPTSEYTCTGELIKAIPFSGITSVINPTKVDKEGKIIEEDYKKRYDREKMIFKPGVRISSIDLGSTYAAGTGGYDASVNYTGDIVNAIDILDNPDQPLDLNVKTLIDKYNEGDTKTNVENY